MPEQVTPPPTPRIAPAVPPPASPCRVARLARFMQKRCPRFPSVGVMQPPGMADRASRSNPNRAPGGRNSQHGRLDCSSWPAAQRRKFPEERIARGYELLDAPVPDTGERVIYAECVAADGQRSRLRPGPMYSGTNTPGRQETTPRLQPMRLSAARPPPAGPSIPIRPTHPGWRLAGCQPSAASPHASGRPPR